MLTEGKIICWTVKPQTPCLDHVKTGPIHLLISVIALQFTTNECRDWNGSFFGGGSVHFCENAFCGNKWPQSTARLTAAAARAAAA